MEWWTVQVQTAPKKKAVFGLFMAFLKAAVHLVGQLMGSTQFVRTVSCPS